MHCITRPLTFFTARFAQRACLQIRVMNRHHLQQTGPFVIACTHLSHTEPAIVSCLLKRPVSWVARSEYFRQPGLSYFLRLFDSLSVERDAVSFSGIRGAVHRCRTGGIVGIFPEGGVRRKDQTIFRGGPVKLGVCVIARRANVPIIPVIVTGTEKLNTVYPWIPGADQPVRIAVGRPVWPDVRRNDNKSDGAINSTNLQSRFNTNIRTATSTADSAPSNNQHNNPHNNWRQQRVHIGEQLSKEFVTLYAQMLSHFAMVDKNIP